MRYQASRDHSSPIPPTPFLALSATLYPEAIAYFFGILCECHFKKVWKSERFTQLSTDAP